MTDFHISGRCVLPTPPADWREQLAALLGSKPRRIGAWAELGLYGALLCMEDAGEATLPPDALVMLTSRHGIYTATSTALEQMRSDLPMPLTFLQTQPSQLLALLAARMDWTGNACFFAHAHLKDLLRLAAAQTEAGGALLGCVDEVNGGSTSWLRLRRGVSDKYDSAAAFGDWMSSPDVSSAGLNNTWAKGVK
jgi:hypothetical protein